MLVVQFGWKEEIPVSFASSFCLNWTWCDSNIISTTLFLHLKKRSSSSSSSSSSLNQFEEMYPLRVMGAGGIWTSESSGFTTFFFFPSFFFQLSYLKWDIGLQVLHVTQCSLGFKSLLRTHSPLFGASALKHYPALFRISVFFLIRLFFDLFIIEEIFSYCYRFTRLFCALRWVSMFLSINSWIFSFTTKKSSIEWLISSYRQYFGLLILSTSAGHFSSRSHISLFLWIGL